MSRAQAEPADDDFTATMRLFTLARLLMAWFVMLLLCVLNGAARDVTYGRFMGTLAAHQWSTVIAVPLLGAVIWVYVRRYPPASGSQAAAFGLFWTALTVAFEFLFFHYAGGHAWSELWGNYNLLEGRLWPVLLLWIAVAPWLFRRIRRGHR